MEFNVWYVVMLLSALLAWGAQAMVRKVYAKYKAAPNQRGATGLELAKSLLARNGLHAVSIVQTPGAYTDHFNPETGTLHLSEEVLKGNSITSMGIVAHEVGHAVQHAKGFRFSRLRLKLARPVGMLSSLSPLVFMGGMFMGISALMVVGGLMLASQALFALVTMPVELDASRRAVAMLEETGWAVAEERKSVKGVLWAAAMTYATNLGRRLAIFLFFAGIFGTVGGIGWL